MLVRNIKVSNFKSFRHIDVNLGKLNVIVGANASGIGLPDHQDTDTVTKEEFDDLMSRTRFDSRVDFMQEILNFFSVDVAIGRNTSFR